MNNENGVMHKRNKRNNINITSANAMSLTTNPDTMKNQGMSYISKRNSQKTFGTTSGNSPGFPSLQGGTNIQIAASD